VMLRPFFFSFFPSLSLSFFFLFFCFFFDYLYFFVFAYVYIYPVFVIKLVVLGIFVGASPFVQLLAGHSLSNSALEPLSRDLHASTLPQDRTRDDPHPLLRVVFSFFFFFFGTFSRPLCLSQYPSPSPLPLLNDTVYSSLLSFAFPRQIYFQPYFFFPHACRRLCPFPSAVVFYGVLS